MQTKQRLAILLCFLCCILGAAAQQRSVFYTAINTKVINGEIRRFTVNGVTFEMVEVEGGTFTMGATAEQGSDADSDEKPAHEVTLNSYMIGCTEVTQALWQAVMGKNPSSFKGDNLPVEEVSWNDCREFIHKLNALTGKRFRLPTEAEWEYAARGGNSSRGYKYSGSNNLGEVGWFTENSSSTTHPVGTKKANELGIYDMSGNVWEWCNDWYGNYTSSSQTNPTGPSSGSNRVFRGGSWGNLLKVCQLPYRGNFAPNFRYGGLGLRLVLDINEEDYAFAQELKHVIVQVTNGKNGKIFNFMVNGACFEMVEIKGGLFKRGATKEQDSEADADESPTRLVRLNNYVMGCTEVTQELWKAVMGSNPSYFKGDYLPVEQVSWDDCQEFIRKLNIITGETFRLPTEAEWEYAARGGKHCCDYKYSGSNNIDEVAWFKNNRGYMTQVVGSKKANELGLYDMSGNVWEWCSDWYGDYPSPFALSLTNPAGHFSGSHRVVRGGSWFDASRDCRVSNRGHISPGYSFKFLGLRLVLVR